MAANEFAKKVGKTNRKLDNDRGYICYMRCTATSPLSVPGADEDIPLMKNRGVDFSGVQVGDTLIVLRMRTNMICLGYL